MHEPGLKKSAFWLLRCQQRVPLRSILFLLLMLRPDYPPSCTTSGNDSKNAKTLRTSYAPRSSSFRGSPAASGSSRSVHACAAVRHLATPFVSHHKGKLF